MYFSNIVNLFTPKRYGNSAISALKHWFPTLEIFQKSKFLTATSLSLFQPALAVINSKNASNALAWCFSKTTRDPKSDVTGKKRASSNFTYKKI